VEERLLEKETMTANFLRQMALAAACFVTCGTILHAECRDRYVDSNARAANDAGPGTKRHPWKTLAPLNAHSFCAGEHIYFAKGSNYQGGFVVKESGTEARPIVFASYGKGAAPSFSNPDFAVLNGNVIQITGSYIVIDGLHFHDGAASPTVKDADVLRVADVFIAKGADHNVIKNSEVNNSPVGFHICGQYTLITHNHLHDTTRYLAGANWGPIGIILSNANNEISYNRITNYLSIGGKYGADGGALEFDPRVYGDSIHDIKVHHNYSYGNEGFIESTRSATQPTGKAWIAYNVSDDYQEFILLWQGRDWTIENNTVLRVLPKNSVTDVVFTFKEDGNRVRNNIFVVNASRKVFSDNGTQVYKMANWAGQQHNNNLYYSVDASQTDPAGVPLGPGEKVGDPRFVDFAKRDLHLQLESPAINAGEASGTASSTDFDGNPVPAEKPVDMGAFEFQGKGTG
jgi:hypothetical protein